MSDISARINIDGAKQAQKDLEAVGKAAKKLDGTDIEIPIEADDKASKILEGVEQKTKGLDGLDAKVAVTANDQASADIQQVEDRLEDLSREDKLIILRGRSDQLESEIRKVNSQLHTLSAADVRIVIAARNEAQADLDRVETEIRQLDGETATVRAEANDRATPKLREASREVDNLDGKTAQVRIDSQGFEAAESAMAGMGGSAGLVAGAMTTTTGQVGALVAGLGLAVNEQAQMALEAQTTATLTGATVEEASRLQAVWQSSGADANDLNDVLLQMNGVLQTSPELAAQLGINLNDGRTVAERFVQVMAILDQTTLGAAEKAQLMSQLFGEEGVRQVARLTTVIGTDLQGAMDDVADTKVMSEEDVERAVDLQRAFNNAMTALQGLIGGVAGGLIPALTRAAGLAEKVIELGEHEIVPGGGSIWETLFAMPGVEGFLTIMEEIDKAANGEELVGSLAPGFEAVEDAATSATTAVDGFMKANRPISDMPATWQTAVDAVKRMRDGLEPTAEQMQAVLVLTQQYGIEAPEVFNRAAQELDAQSEAIQEAGDNYRELASSIGEAMRSFDAAEAATEGFATALERVNEASDLDFSQMALNTVESFDSMKESLEGLKDVAVDWSNVDLSPDSVDELRGVPDELAAVTDSISGMRDTIQTELQAAFDTGGIQAYTEKAAFFAGEIRTQFPAAFQAMGASEEEARRLTKDLLDDLELLPSDIEIQIRLAREEEARNALEAFSSVIDQLPIERQIAIRTAIAEGDIEGALSMLNTELFEAGFPPITLQTAADPSGAAADAEAFAASEQPPATMGLDLDPSDAEDTAKSFQTTKREADPVGVDADTKRAIATLILLRIYAALLAPVVNVTANAASAESTINNTARARNSTINVGTSGVAQADTAINNAARNRVSTISVRTVPAGDKGGVAGSMGMIAGEGSGPEIINGRYLTRGPTWVPPGTRVTSTKRTREILHRHHFPKLPRRDTGTPGGLSPFSVRPVTINVNAAVIGNRFDVMRAVAKAGRDKVRIMGSRG